MTTIQFPLYTGGSYTASLYQINGTQIQTDVPANEIVPGVFNVDFETVPDGFYRIVVSSNGAPLFTDTVEVVASNEINNVSSEDSDQANEAEPPTVTAPELGSGCAYPNAYPNSYPNAHPCDAQPETNGITIKQRHCSDFRLYTGEEIEVCREVLDCDGNPIDFTGVELRFKTWGRRRTTITNDLLATGTTTGFCVTIPAQGKQTLSSEWAVRNSAGQVVASGPFVVRGRP